MTTYQFPTAADIKAARENETTISEQMTPVSPSDEIMGHCASMGKGKTYGNFIGPKVLAYRNKRFKELFGKVTYEEMQTIVNLEVLARFGSPH